MWPGPGLRGSSLGNAEERWQDQARQSGEGCVGEGLGPWGGEPGRS